MERQTRILITGGSGVIGRRLTTLLQQKGYSVRHLGRSRRKGDVESFTWNPHAGTIEEGAVDGVDAIVHLAGMDISARRWNAQVKDEILFSRAGTARLLREHLARKEHRIRAFISASGTSYYGTENTGRASVEEDPPADDFMARVTVAWEREAQAFSTAGIRVVCLRTGFVLHPQASGLKKLAQPVRMFVGAALGSGRQMANWIHIDDLCAMYLRALEDSSLHGAYNAVGPAPVTHQDFMGALARTLRRPLWLPNVPGFLVKAIAGEVAYVVLEGGPVSPEKIEQTGFRFSFQQLETALEDVYARD